MGLNLSHAPVAKQHCGKGPRTKRQRRLLHPEWEAKKTKRARPTDRRPDLTEVEMWGPTLTLTRLVTR